MLILIMQTVLLTNNKVMKKYFICVAFTLLLTVQILDKEHRYLIVQILIAILIIIASIMMYIDRKNKDKSK